MRWDLWGNENFYFRWCLDLDGSRIEQLFSSICYQTARTYSIEEFNLNIELDALEIQLNQTKQIRAHSTDLIFEETE